MQLAPRIVRLFALRVLSLAGWALFTVLSAYAAAGLVLWLSGSLPIKLIRELSAHPGFRILVWLGAVMLLVAAATLRLLNPFSRAMMATAAAFTVGLAIAYELANTVGDHTLTALVLATVLGGEGLALFFAGREIRRRGQSKP